MLIDQTPPDQASTKRDLWLCFGLALAVRVLAVLWLNFAPERLRPNMGIFAADSLLYDALAQNLFAGHGYVLRGDPYDVCQVSPLYPVLLSSQYVFWGGGVLGAGLVNALLGALTAPLLYLLARDCFAGEAGFSRRVGLTAACLFAVYPLEVFNTPYVLKENFSILLTVGFVFACGRSLVAASRPEAARYALVAGVLLGLSVLSRFPHAGLVFTVLFYALWSVWSRRRPERLRAGPSWPWPAAALLLLGTGLALAPWLAHTYRVFGQIVLTSKGPSAYLYAANSSAAEPETTGYFEGSRGVVARNRPINIATRRDPVRRERIFAERALRSLAQPGHVARLVWSKLLNMWRPVWKGSSARTWLLLGLPYLLMMALALPGLALAWRDPSRTAASSLVYAVLTAYVLGHLAFYGMIRERQYVEPYLMLFAAFAFWKTLRRRGAPASSCVETRPGAP